MPIYEYGCSGCGKQVEVLVRNKTDIPSRCPACGAARLKKLFSSFAVAAADPSPQCGSCPTAADSCSAGQCSSHSCPFSS